MTENKNLFSPSKCFKLTWFTMVEKNYETKTFQMLQTDFKIRLFVHHA